MPALQSLLITGANGFIGARLCRDLTTKTYRVRGALRRPDQTALPGVELCPIGDIDGDTDWRPLLAGVEAVVHCAGRAHIQRETAADPLAAYRRVNSDGSINLAQQAADARVRRFLFVSTLGAQQDDPSEMTPYQRSKREAENALQTIAGASGMELVILRPPVVYGPGAPGNFARLRQAVAQGWPLPLASIENQRSYLYIANLSSAVAACLSHPAAAGAVLALSDGAPVSTPDLVRAVADALGRRANLIPCPPAPLRWLLRVTGRGALIPGLTGSLVADDDEIRTRLAWTPPYSLAEGLAETLAETLPHG